MKFEIHRNLENNIFTTRMKFKEFGGKDLEPEEEIELLNDFGAPKINLANIDFTGKVKKDDKGVVSMDEGGEELSFILNAKTLTVDENFRADLKVNPKKLDFVTIKKDKKDKEEKSVKDSILDDSRTVSECVCLIFEEKIKEAIENELNELKEMYTNFEKDNPLEFTI